MEDEEIGDDSPREDGGREREIALVMEGVRSGWGWGLLWDARTQ